MENSSTACARSTTRSATVRSGRAGQVNSQTRKRWRDVLCVLRQTRRQETTRRVRRVPFPPDRVFTRVAQVEGGESWTDPSRGESG
jgi:hypothetical protein